MPSATCDGLHFALYLPILLAALFLIGRTDLKCLVYFILKKTPYLFMIKNNKKYISFVLNDVAPTKDVFASKMFLSFLVALLADITKKKKKIPLFAFIPT